MAENNKNKILGELSEKLGLSQQQIESAANSGDIKNMLQNADKAQVKQIENILSDPEKAKKLLESPQAQALLKLFGGE